MARPGSTLAIKDAGTNAGTASTETARQKYDRIAAEIADMQTKLDGATNSSYASYMAKALEALKDDLNESFKELPQAEQDDIKAEEAQVKAEAAAEAAAKAEAEVAAAEQAKLDAEAKAKAEAAEKAAKEAEANVAAAEQAKLDAEAKAKAEADEKARLEAVEAAKYNTDGLDNNMVKAGFKKDADGNLIGPNGEMLTEDQASAVYESYGVSISADASTGNVDALTEEEKLKGYVIDENSNVIDVNGEVVRELEETPMETPTETPTETVAGTGTGTGTASPYYIDPRNIGVEGTEANDIYNTYLQGAKTQYEQGMKSSQEAEAGMQSELSGNRQALLEQMRASRRSKLKSGLSSAQIANEEVQSLLMGQSTAQQVAGTYYDQRQQVQDTYAQAPVTAAESAYAQYAQQNLSGSAFAASAAGDASYQAQLYAQMTDEQKAAYNNVTTTKTTTTE